MMIIDCAWKLSSEKKAFQRQAKTRDYAPTPRPGVAGVQKCNEKMRKNDGAKMNSCHSVLIVFTTVSTARQAPYIAQIGSEPLKIGLVSPKLGVSKHRGTGSGTIIASYHLISWAATMCGLS